MAPEQPDLYFSLKEMEAAEALAAIRKVIADALARPGLEDDLCSALSIMRQRDLGDLDDAPDVFKLICLGQTCTLGYHIVGEIGKRALRNNYFLLGLNYWKACACALAGFNPPPKLVEVSTAKKRRIFSKIKNLMFSGEFDAPICCAALGGIRYYSGSYKKECGTLGQQDEFLRWLVYAMADIYAAIKDKGVLSESRKELMRWSLESRKELDKRDFAVHIPDDGPFV